ncbi:MAG: hypothetical protein ACLUKN_05210 [Bacilli bacterium]
MKRIIALLIALVSVVDCGAALKKIESDIPYQPQSSDEYILERCKLDIYALKQARKKTSVIVWFHGGGITAGTNPTFPS